MKRGVKNPGRLRARFLFLALVACVLIVSRAVRKERRRSPAPALQRDKSLFLVTGYCNCGKCCGWSRRWWGLGEAVYDYGPMKGRPKRVGITATGTVARHGTIAADYKLFPPGTRLEVPGYGIGTVEDMGSAIKGRHLDVWFPTHEAARKWGARWLKVSRR